MDRLKMHHFQCYKSKTCVFYILFSLDDEVLVYSGINILDLNH